MVQQQAHGVQPVAALHLVEALLDGVFGHGGLDGDLLRLAHELLGQLLNALGVGGREQQRLAFLGGLLHHGGNVVKEAHVQHAVGFVQHQRVQVFQRKVFALQQVHDAARCADHDVRAVLQAGALAARGHATAQRHHLDVFLGPRQAANFHRHLVGQLARGAQHHGLHRKPARVELGQQRQRKGGRLAAAGLGLGNQVFAGQRNGQAGGLNGRHGLVAELLQVGQRGGREGERGESVHAPIIGGGA